MSQGSFTLSARTRLWQGMADVYKRQVIGAVLMEGGATQHQDGVANRLDLLQAVVKGGGPIPVSYTHLPVNAAGRAAPGCKDGSDFLIFPDLP